MIKDQRQNLTLHFWVRSGNAPYTIIVPVPRMEIFIWVNLETSQCKFRKIFLK